MDRVIRAMIADDEPLARDGIRLHLTRHGDVEIVGEAGDGQEAAGLVAELRPDLLFLDVQMPALDGFEVLETVAGVHLPAVVLVTAYDRYAIRAFEVHALDYLLKPFTADRLDQALDVAREEIASRGSQVMRRRLLDLLAERGLETAYLTRVVVRHGERFVLVRLADVDVFEANGNYIKLRTASGNYMIRMTMAELETKLNPTRFARIHRSTMVNIDRIKEITPAWHGDFEVHLANGHTLRLSRNFRERLLP